MIRKRRKKTRMKRTKSIRKSDGEEEKEWDEDKMKRRRRNVRTRMEEEGCKGGDDRWK